MFRSVDPGKYPLRADREDDVQALLARLDPPHQVVVGSLPHPLRALWGDPVRPVVVRAEAPMEARKVLVGGIHRTAALHLVTEVVAVAAGKQLLPAA